VIVVGSGVFGSLLAGYLRTLGVSPVTAARTGPRDLPLDVEDVASLRAVLGRGDVVVDTAGPFATRTTNLLRCAIEKRCDVVDINEHIDYAVAVRGMAEPIRDAGIRVLSSCSSVAVLSHTLVSLSGLAPTGASILLMPAAREAASRATAATLLRSLGRPARSRRNGALVPAKVWGSSRPFALPRPLGAAQGRLFESADAVLLPESWPHLTDVDFWVDAGVPGAGRPLSLLVRVGPPGLWSRVSPGALAAVARCLGRPGGAYAVETRDRAGATVTAVLWGAAESHRMAVIPAALAAHELASTAPVAAGLAAPHQQVPLDALLRRLHEAGFRYADSRGTAGLGRSSAG
jgi:hypothetical protein